MRWNEEEGASKILLPQGFEGERMIDYLLAGMRKSAIWLKN